MTGQSVAHFELLDKLGEGGMGVVYRGRDKQLNRLVAIKLLRADKVGTAERRHRFLQEARAASALNHPNIVTIYEVGESGGADFIAMEFVEGRTLDQLIPAKGMRLNEALKYAIQLADALSRAHNAGITHRDLKPANIMVNAEGRLKVLDFGLAKLNDAATSSSESSPTFTAASQASPVTAEGAIIGTAAYMSPEQAEGRVVDARSDIFSFGAVLFEMVSGHRAFQRATPMATLAAVMREDPPKLPPTTPRDLERLVMRCLRKDPERRAQHMSDVRLALEEIKEESDSGTSMQSAGVAPARKHSYIVPIVAAVVLAGAAGSWWYLGASKNGLVVEAKRTVLTSYSGREITPALSPDGKYVAFGWNGEKEDNMDIYVKLVDAGTPVRLTTDPAPDHSPSYSHDGNFIAFVRGGPDAGYYIVPALGGAERKVGAIPTFPSHRSSPTADWAPDGKSLVVVDTSADPPCLALLSLSSGEMKRLTKPPHGSLGDYTPLVSPDGKWLAFGRFEGVTAGDWFILPLESNPGAEPKRLTDFHADIRFGAAWMPNSTELLLAGMQEGERRLWRVPTSGDFRSARQPSIFGDGDTFPAVARNGGRAVVVQAFFNSNIWRLDLAKPTDPPVRVVASSRSEQQPDVSPDGTRLAFISSRSGRQEVWVAKADGSSSVQLTTEGATPTAPRWSPDGKQIAFAKRPGGNVDVYVVSSQGGPVRRLTTAPSSDASAYWSADGKWIYFASNRTGRQEVWRTPADGSGPDVQITRNSGWRSTEFANGTMLAYQKFDLPGLWKMPIAGGPEQKIADTPALATYHGVGNLGFWYHSDRKLHRVDLQTGQDSVIATLPRQASGGTTNFGVSPDLRWLYYIQTDQSVSDLALIDNFR